MADLKISQLTAITTLTPATDVLPVVDVTGTTKKITTNQILGAGGTATLASATITGALTVDTTTLVVNAAGYADRVGIGTATPALPLDVVGGMQVTSGSAGGLYQWAYGASASSRSWRAWNDVSANGDFQISTSTTRTGSTYSDRYRIDVTGIHEWFNTSGTAMTLNSQGLGVGVTPSAWASTYRALQIGIGTSLTGITNDVDVNLVNNARFDGTNWKYTNSSPAERYRTASGTHYWYNAASGTAGNNITWTQAMTLATSGNLLIGKTGENGTVGAGIIGQADGAIWSTMAASTSASNTLLVYSTGAAAYRFYVGLDGTVNATNATISAISDARFKENVQDIDVGLGAILALKPRKFDWKAGKGKDIKGDRGFIAQEFEQVFPQLVDEWADPSPEGEAPYKSVRQDLIPVLVKAIQELAAEVNALKNA